MVAACVFLPSPEKEKKEKDRNGMRMTPDA